jgi:hypothetical protein
MKVNGPEGAALEGALFRRARGDGVRWLLCGIVKAAKGGTGARPERPESPLGLA